MASSIWVETDIKRIFKEQDMNNVKNRIGHDGIATKYVFSLNKDVFLTEQEESQNRKQQLMPIPFRWTAL